MRIVGGKFRGRKLAEPKSREIRPTTDRNRESLFNIITHNWPEKLDNTRILDIFAGTGALGFEALSRGGNFALFIEQGVEARGLLRQNIEVLGLTGHTKIFRRDATRPGPIGTRAPFDLVFVDPPYKKGLGEKAITALIQNNWLKNEALVILEESLGYLPSQFPHLKMLDERKFGESAFGFYQLVTQL